MRLAAWRVVLATRVSEQLEVRAHDERVPRSSAISEWMARGLLLIFRRTRLAASGYAKI
jgi:hypothetical protein